MTLIADFRWKPSREKQEQLRKDAEWEDKGSKRIARKLPLITLSLVSINVIVFIWSKLSVDFQALLLEFGFVPSRLDQISGLPTLISHMFLHADLLHISYNMLLFLQFGSLAELKLERIRFLLLYLLSGIFAVLIYTLLAPESEITLVGASGAIFGALASYALLYPKRPLYIMRRIKLPSIVGVAFVFMLEIIYAFIGINPYIANTAHLGGGIAGVSLTAIFFPKETIKIVWNLLDAMTRALIPQTSPRKPESDKSVCKKSLRENSSGYLQPSPVETQGSLYRILSKKKLNQEISFLLTLGWYLRKQRPRRSDIES